MRKREQKPSIPLSRKTLLRYLDDAVLIAEEAQDFADKLLQSNYAGQVNFSFQVEEMAHAQRTSKDAIRKYAITHTQEFLNWEPPIRPPTPIVLPISELPTREIEAAIRAAQANSSVIVAAPGPSDRLKRTAIMSDLNLTPGFYDAVAMVGQMISQKEQAEQTNTPNRKQRLVAKALARHKKYEPK